MVARGVLLLGLILAHPGTAKAAVIPFGPQNHVLLTTVTGAWGWTQIYRGDYSVNSVAIAPILAAADDWIMIGGIRDGSATIDVLAAVRTSDFITHTNQNVTNLFNGSQWYYNGGSLGFAGAGDTIAQTQADTNGLAERDRLSWHTNGPGGFIGEYTASPTNIRFGWRSGNNTGLNISTDFDKIIFTASDVNAAVPEPATFALLGSGIVALVVRRRRASRTA